MARPTARIEERVSARCNAIATARDRQRELAAADREILAARRDLHRAQERLRAAESAMHELCKREERLIADLRAANQADCAA